MSYTTIAAGAIAAGAPDTQDLWSKVNTGLVDHETRVTTLEASITARAPIMFEILGSSITSDIIGTQVLTYRVDKSFTLLACRLMVMIAGTGGTLSVDVKYQRSGGAWTSILSGALSAASSSGSSFSVAGSLATTAFQAGDYLRLDITGVQTAQQDFSVALEQ